MPVLFACQCGPAEWRCVEMAATMLQGLVCAALPRSRAAARRRRCSMPNQPAQHAAVQSLHGIRWSILHPRPGRARRARERRLLLATMSLACTRAAAPQAAGRTERRRPHGGPQCVAAARPAAPPVAAAATAGGELQPVGRRSTLLAALQTAAALLVVRPAAADPGVTTVGPGGQYATLAEALAATPAGGIIEVAGGRCVCVGWSLRCAATAALRLDSPLHPHPLLLQVSRAGDHHPARHHSGGAWPGG